MSASINLHGPLSTGARVVGPGQFTKDPFVSLDIHSDGASVTLLSIDAGSLEALSAAVGEARVLLAGIASPHEEDMPEPGEDGEAQRIAEVFEDARAEQDRGWPPSAADITAAIREREQDGRL